MSDEIDDTEDPPKKHRGDNNDDDRPPKRRRNTEDDKDERPTRTRRKNDDGPRLKANDSIPIVMLIAFIGSAVALLTVCIGCGWFSFDLLVGGGRSGGSGGDGGGWSGHEFALTNVSRTPGIGPFNPPPTVNWTVTQKQNTSTGPGQYYVVMKTTNGAMVTEPIAPGGKGWTYSSSRPRIELRGQTGRLEVWVEKRPNPLASGKVVSEVVILP
ncbi:MAG: hypothetical protein MUF18_00450 [Fimbriiglobus sp.]|nr:hypothetical protein [Fimbriiglobus sp.]